MSAEGRADLADAARVGADVRVTPYRTQSAAPGTGHVRVAQRVRDDSGFGWIDTYEVVITLPQDIAAAEKWIESHQDALLVALAPVMWVTTVAPTDLQFDASGFVPGLVITGTVGS